MEHILWHNRYEEDWLRAFPIGNGRIAAMVYGGPQKEILQLNEESLWSGKQLQESYNSSPELLGKIRELLFQKRIDEAYTLCEKHLLSDPPMVRHYQTFGQLSLDFADKTPETNYRKVLDLCKAVVETSYEKNGVLYESRCFASMEQDILCYRLTASQPFHCDVTLERIRDAVTIAEKASLQMTGRIVMTADPMYGDAGEGMGFGGVVRLETDGATEAGNGCISVSQAKTLTLYIGLATNYRLEKMDIDETLDPVAAAQCAARRGERVGFEECLRQHLESHLRAYRCAELTLDGPDRSCLPTDVRIRQMQAGEYDPGLICLYFHFGRYLLLSSSGKNAKLPANLQGKWCHELTPPWGSDYHTNINLQMNYWPAENCNLRQTVKPLLDYMEKTAEFGEDTAKRLYYADGWVMHHTSDIFGRTGIHDGIQWGVFPMAGSWMCLNLWEHYEFSGDKKYLERLYPMLTGAARFVESFLVEDEKGYLVTNPSTSPENRYFYYNEAGEKCSSMFTHGSTIDFQIIYALLTRVICACRILDKDWELEKRMEKILNRLPPLRISQRYGTVCEWIQDYEETEPKHRHISHMFGLYPSDQINETVPEIFEAAKKTVARRLQSGGGATGWSRAWIVNFYARFKEGDAALHHLSHLVKNCTADNLFDMHPPFQIDGNFGGIAGIGEMLLQSHLGEPGDRILEVLPALPEKWSKGSFCGLRGRGGYTVDAAWEWGMITKLTVRADRDGLLKLRRNGPMEKLEIPDHVRMENGILYLPMKANQTVCLSCFP